MYKEVLRKVQSEHQIIFHTHADMKLIFTESAQHWLHWLSRNSRVSNRSFSVLLGDADDWTWVSSSWRIEALPLSCSLFSESSMKVYYYVSIDNLHCLMPFAFNENIPMILYAHKQQSPKQYLFFEVCTLNY